MFKRLAQSKFVQEALGFLLASYLGLVRRTNRFAHEPADLDAAIVGHTPLIVAMWHGQHLMVSFAWPKSIPRMAALISRSGDGGLQAAALRRLGVTPVRGSGSSDNRKGRKGGAPALRELMRQLEGGASVAMTADAGKRARVAALGVVTLARLSGRPIAPTAVAVSRRFDFHSWDRASLGRPFGRGAIVIGDFIYVAPDADDAAMEEARRAVEAGLDAAHARAYALVGGRDPGADLRHS
ncbi:MAG: lysophospholipid acyltransferase family protein [Roseiarcus sp.]|jgi:hypothetical protein